MVDSLFFCATLTGRRGGHTQFVQAGAETSNSCAEAVKPDPRSSWETHLLGRGWKCGVLWDCLPTPHSISDPTTAPHVCCCQMNWWDVVQRVQMGVLIWGVVRLHSMDGWALSGADVQAPCHGVLETVWVHWKVVRWCRTQVSSHNSQGVVDSWVNEAGMSTVAPDRSAALCDWIDQDWDGYSQCCCSNTPAGASKPTQENDAWCQLFAKWLKVSVIREWPIQYYFEVFGLGAEGQGFVVAFDFQLMFCFLVVKKEDCRHRFCSAEL